MPPQATTQVASVKADADDKTDKPAKGKGTKEARPPKGDAAGS